MIDSGKLKVWRLHPQSCPIVPAEKTLHGDANRAAVRWCGPFTNANRAGWWLFPPIDIDIVWLGGSEFEWTALTSYSDADRHLTRFLLDEADSAHPGLWLEEEGRTKLTWGAVEDGVVQIWSGCIFQTPPGWALHLRSPVNFPPRPFHVMEAIIESDWLQYDIWLNVLFDRPGERVELRRDAWPPLAQIVPVPRASYDPVWKLEEETLNRNSEEANMVFEYFVSYNEKKFASGGKDPRSRTDPSQTKDSSTYFKERKRAVGKPSPPEP